MSAIIKTGGKQFLVNVGDVIYVEKLDADAGATVEFTDVLMKDGLAGNPLVSGAKVTGKVLKHGKQKKITIFKYRAKSKSTRTKQGHRQPYTRVEITGIK